MHQMYRARADLCLNNFKLVKFDIFLLILSYVQHFKGGNCEYLRSDKYPGSVKDI